VLLTVVGRLSIIVIFADFVPAEVGLNDTEKVLFPFGAIVHGRSDIVLRSN
jgi:hypothetical protein